MTIHDRATVIALPDRSPAIADSALVMPGAVIAGQVSLAEGVGIWPGASLRAEEEPITIGEGSNVQDNCSLHVDTGAPLTIGRNVSIGHNAVVHGCTVEDDVLIGMHATVMNRARIGDECLVAAGALVPEGMEVPPRSLVAGVPGKVRRELTDEEVARLHRNAETYEAHRDHHRDAGVPTTE